jgi:antibiotic biosynthesis monooxygenase (ABM) superfamily enzyme
MRRAVSVVVLFGVRRWYLCGMADSPSRTARNRWLARLLAALVLYVIAVGANLLIRTMLHGWTWYDDLLSTSLITSLAVPAIVLLTSLTGGTRQE